MTKRTQKMSAILMFQLAAYYDQSEEQQCRIPLSNWYDRLEANLKIHRDPCPDHGGNDGDDLLLWTKRYADAVVAKLDTVNPKGPEEWLAAVREAVISEPLNVIINSPDKKSVPLVEFPGFAEVVAEELAVLVAPKNSEWLRRLERNARALLGTAQPPFSASQITAMLRAWREGIHITAELVPGTKKHNLSGFVPRFRRSRRRR